ncbi:hypothetical protein KJ940_04720, partial [Myxococcota bacterium]|nr:hypothetical protein [Myxococcota bacterium]
AGGVAGSGGEAGGGGIGGEAGGSVEEPEWECKPDAPCADGFVCWYIFEGFPELGVCVEGCDPVNRAGCDEGETCYLADEEGGTLCFDTGDRGLGEDCADLSLCVDGADCFQVEPDRWECRAFCDLRNPCPDGGACLPSGRGHWGACLTP